MREGLAILLALFFMTLFFLPAYYIGPVYLLLTVLYLLALYGVERLKLGKTAEEAVSAAFFLLIMYLTAKKRGESFVEVLCVVALLIVLNLAQKHFRSGH